MQQMCTDPFIYTIYMESRNKRSHSCYCVLHHCLVKRPVDIATKPCIGAPRLATYGRHLTCAVGTVFVRILPSSAKTELERHTPRVMPCMVAHTGSNAASRQRLIVFAAGATVSCVGLRCLRRYA